MSRNRKPRNEAETQDRERALATLAQMRRDKVSLRAAARAYETDPKTVRRFAGSAIRRDKSGRYRAKPYDRIPRTLNFITEAGSVPITVRDSRTASRIAEHSNAVRKYVRPNSDASALEQFKNKSFRVRGVRYRFVVDLDVLNILVSANSLAGIESLYYARMAS